MTDPTKGTLDGFLREHGADDPEALDALMSIGAALEPTEPSEALRQKTLGALSLDGRFERFADQAGRLLDLGEDDARTVLNRIDQPADWYGDPKVGPTAMLWIEGGPGVRDAVTGFVRVMAGEDFPEHKHIGQEHVLVMQGSLIDSLDGKRHGPGEVIPQPPGSQHSFHVPEDGPDLLILSVVQEAVEIDGQRLGPDDRLG